MKRDTNLIRAILLTVEETDERQGLLNPSFQRDGENIPANEVTYHIGLLNERGLIKAVKLDSGWLIEALTWEGHEFLDAAKNEGVWKRVQKTVNEKGGSLPFDVVKALAIQFAREAVGLG